MPGLYLRICQKKAKHCPCALALAADHAAKNLLGMATTAETEPVKLAATNSALYVMSRDIVRFGTGEPVSQVKASGCEVELSRNRFTNREAFVSHSHAALTPRARLRLAQLIVEGGWTYAAAAKMFMIAP